MRRCALCNVWTDNDAAICTPCEIAHGDTIDGMQRKIVAGADPIYRPPLAKNTDGGVPEVEPPTREERILASVAKSFYLRYQALNPYEDLMEGYD